jgi:hypothetical protein
MNWESWQQRWDLQQQAYLPDREERFAAMLDAVEAACGPRPLGCSTSPAAPDRSPGGC